MATEHRFTRLYFLGCWGTLAVALAVNLLGNSTGLFPSPWVPAPSERAWKTRRLDEAARSAAPRVVVLGSSRVMQVQPPYLQAITGKATFNYGVSVATPTDYLAQLRYLLAIGCRPAQIVVGVDELTFRHDRRPWEIENLGHLGFFVEMPYPDNLEVLSGVLRRCDLGTTWTSLTRLWKPRPKPPQIETVNNLLLSDGYLVYCNHVRTIRDGTFDQAANIEKDVQKWQAEGPAIAAGMLRPNPQKLKRFDEFLSLAKANGIEVRAMFLPSHPDYERQVFSKKLRQARSALSRIVSGICQQHGARYRDFTKLASYEGDPREFFDSVHQTPANLQRMINVLFGIEAGRVVADIPDDAEILKHLPTGTTLTVE